MDVLFDTNILIHRESDPVVPESLRKLERELNENGQKKLVHPLSIEEIRQDPDDDRREKSESRIETYARLRYPPEPGESDAEFRSIVSESEDMNERVDNMLLFAVYEDAVDFLVTEDKEMHRKALKLEIQDRVFSIEEGIEHFSDDAPLVCGPAAIERTTVGNLDLSDPIFDSLRAEYDGFTEWAKSIEDRPAWVNYTADDSLGALLILKLSEIENIGDNPPLGRDERLKISTMKVAEPRWGSKVGELLISIAIREAIEQGISKVYLTHYVKEEDYLVELIDSYGFEHASEKPDGEGIFQKRLRPPHGSNPDPLKVATQYYPSFYEGRDVDKFIVPIQPRYHNKLFTSYEKRQPGLNEFDGVFRSEGNAIRKAYLSNAKTRQIDPGDLLLFYRSSDHQELTSLGVCQEVEYGLTDPDEISRIVGKRSVFSESEIEEISEAPTTVLLFSWHFDLSNPLSYDLLRENDVLAGPPQVMQRVDEQGYTYIRNKGGIDGRFARD